MFVKLWCLKISEDRGQVPYWRHVPKGTWHFLWRKHGNLKVIHIIYIYIYVCIYIYIHFFFEYICLVVSGDLYFCPVVSSYAYVWYIISPPQFFRCCVAGVDADGPPGALQYPQQEPEPGAADDLGCGAELSAPMDQAAGGMRCGWGNGGFP